MKKRKKLHDKLSESQLESIFKQFLDGYSGQLIDEIHEYLERILSSDFGASGDADNDTYITVGGYPLESDFPDILLNHGNSIISNQFAEFVESYP